MQLYVLPVESTDDFDEFDCGDDDLNGFVQQYANRFGGESYPKAIKAVDRISQLTAGLLFLSESRPLDRTGAPLPKELGSTLVLDSVMVDRRFWRQGVATRLFRDTLKLFAWTGAGKGMQLLAVHTQDEWLRGRLHSEGLVQSEFFSRTSMTVSLLNARLLFPDFVPPARLST